MCSKCSPPARMQATNVDSLLAKSRFNNMHFTRQCSDSIKVRSPKLESFASSFVLMSQAESYQNWPMFHRAIQKIKVARFLWTTVYGLLWVRPIRPQYRFCPLFHSSKTKLCRKKTKLAWSFTTARINRVTTLKCQRSSLKSIGYDIKVAQCNV